MSSAWFEDMLDATADVPALQGALSARMKMPLTIDGILRAKGDGQVFEGRLSGRAVIVKRFGGPKGPQTPARAVSEFDRLRPVMGAGPYRVADILFAAPDLSCVVMERAPGTSLQTVLDGMGEGGARDDLLARCGAWLDAYIGPTRETGSFGPAHWIDRRRRQGDRARMDAGDAAVLQRLLGWMDSRAPDLRGFPVTRGAIHGDFTPMNLHLDDAGAIWGFDIQGTSRMPVARDLARFVVTWLRSSDVGSDALPWRELSALAEPVLSADERAALLPFFLADQLAGRWATLHADAVRKTRVRAAIELFLGAAP